MHSFSFRRARLWSSALLCVAAALAAGCHNHNNTSGFGIGWVTLTNTPADFAAYQINIDTVAMTGKANGQITAVGAAETVDLTKLKDISELWSSASIPNDTYTQITMVVDYTNANIAVIRNGLPVKVKVVDPKGAAVTTVTINITLDPGHPLVIVPTYATTSAQRVALNFDLAASNTVNMSTSTPTLTVKPFVTAATSAADTKPVRVRGPLINSSANVGTYTVYVRPFYDEINSLGSLTVFTDVDKPTVFLLNGTTYVGAAAGVKALSQTSAGTTVTAAYTTYEPTPDVAQSTSAGKFNATYVVAGSTLEDFYTQGMEGDVIARSGNTLTIRGATVQFNDGSSIYYETDSKLLVGPSTDVTADNNTTLQGLNYQSISVGQHIIARGIFSAASSGVVTIDATGSSSTNTGSVRLIATELFGVVSSAGGGQVDLNLSSFGYWPYNVFQYAGTGATPANPSSYSVDTGTLAIPAGVGAGSNIWIDGVVAPFGSAPPDFLAQSISAETSVPARLLAVWGTAGTTAPFSTASGTSLAIDLANARLTSAVIRIGEESIDLKTLPATPRIEPAATPATTAGVPAPFLPLFSIGGFTATAVSTVTSFNTFSSFVTYAGSHTTGSTPVFQLVASGRYNRGNNTFVADSIDVVN